MFIHSRCMHIYWQCLFILDVCISIGNVYSFSMYAYLLDMLTYSEFMIIHFMFIHSGWLYIYCQCLFILDDCISIVNVYSFWMIVYLLSCLFILNVCLHSGCTCLYSTQMCV